MRCFPWRLRPRSQLWTAYATIRTGVLPTSQLTQASESVLNITTSRGRKQSRIFRLWLLERNWGKEWNKQLCMDLLRGDLCLLRMVGSPVRSILGTRLVRRPCTWPVSTETLCVWKSCWKRARLKLTSKTATERHPCTSLPNRILPPSSRCSRSEIMLTFCPIYVEPELLHPQNLLLNPRITRHPFIPSSFRSCAHVCAPGWMSWTMTGRRPCTWPVAWDALNLSKLCWGVVPSAISLVVLATPFTLVWSTARGGKRARRVQSQFI